MTRQSTADMDVEIGRRIRELRTAAGISQEKLGEALDVTFQQVQKQEKGTNRVSASALVLICKRLGITPMDILGPYFDQPSEASALAAQVASLKQQIANIRAAVK